MYYITYYHQSGYFSWKLKTVETFNVIRIAKILVTWFLIYSLQKILLRIFDMILIDCGKLYDICSTSNLVYPSFSKALHGIEQILLYTASTKFFEASAG